MRQVVDESTLLKDVTWLSVKSLHVLKQNAQLSRVACGKIEKSWNRLAKFAQLFDLDYALVDSSIDRYCVQTAKIESASNVAQQNQGSHSLLRMTLQSLEFILPNILIIRPSDVFDLNADKDKVERYDL